MSTTVDLLLKANISKEKLPTKQIEITRLSKATNGKMVFTLKAVSASKYAEIQDSAVSIVAATGEADVNINDMQIAMVIAGVVDPHFKDKQLMEYYHAPTPAELVKTLLLPGEIVTLFNIINELSGFGSDAVQEIKN